MLVNCIPTRQLYNDYLTGFRILACICKGKPPDNLHLNDYGNFTVSGSNLSSLTIGQEIQLDIREDLRNKREGSYKLVGLGGIKTEGEEIKVDPNQEYNILCGFMSPGQAQNVNKAYPNFIYLVLNGRENEINHKNIYNVGEYYLELYIDKVKAACRSILFMPVAMENGIEDSETIEKLSKIYLTPEELQEAFDTNPYHIYIDLVHYPFKRSDKLVLDKHPEFIDSLERCEYGCMEILRQNEAEGDTRINANLLAALAKELIPEAMGHIVEAVKNNQLIHYDEATKYVSIEQTYQEELLIARNIVQRLNNPIITQMNWKPYVEIDGFTLTEEQSQMLIQIQNNSIAFLTAPAGGGKTSTMRALIRMLEGNSYDYTMLCPTGTAAKVLSKTTGRQAYTIHMFLAKKMMCGDFLILEESSMLGVELLAKLLKAVPESTKIVFICDVSQLPSISPGNIVRDILKTRMVNNINLTKIFRYNSSGLITVATDTRNGNPSSFKNNYEDYHFIEADEDSVAQVVKIYADVLNKEYSKQEILILTPFNKTNKGTYAINEAIQKIYNPNDFLDISIKYDGATIRFKIGDRVINKKNNYHVPVLEYAEESGEPIETSKELFIANGSIGVIRGHYREDGHDCLIIQFEEGIGLFKGSDIMNLLLGYAVTIHASQGNQAKAVIVLFDKVHKKMMNRNIEYVAFTRSQEELWVIGDSQTIEEAMEIEETMLRDTWLSDILERGD